MPKVTRGPTRKGGVRPAPTSRTGGASARRSRSRASAKPAFLSHWRNRLSARLRAAQYRAGAAARLVSLACLALAGVTVAVLFGLGRMNDAVGYVGGAAHDALRGAGFRLAAVDVAGAQAASFDDIRTALGLEYGQSIFALDVQAARERVEALDWVGEAQVFRLLPNRVQVVVREQIPMARWQIDGQIVVIDVHGAPIDRAGPQQYARLPLVVGIGAAAPAPQFLAALARFPDIERHVEAAQRVGERRWTLFLNTGAELHLPETDAEATLAIVSRLHRERGILTAPAQVIDLRAPGQIVVRAKGEAIDDGAPPRAAGIGRERGA